MGWNYLYVLDFNGATVRNGYIISSHTYQDYLSMLGLKSTHVSERGLKCKPDIWLQARYADVERSIASWRHQMETFLALLALCAGNSPATGEVPSQRPVTRNLDFSLICPWAYDWVNNRDAGDLRLYTNCGRNKVFLFQFHVLTRRPCH